MSADASRADVAFVVGSRPKFADETAQLLRGRLGAAALCLTGILAAAFVGTSLSGTFSLWWHEHQSSLQRTIRSEQRPIEITVDFQPDDTEVI